MLQRIPLQTMEGVEDNQAVFLHVFKERDDAFLPVAPLDLAFKKVAAVLGERPFKQGVDILKVIIECFPADFRVVGDIPEW